MVPPTTGASLIPSTVIDKVAVSDLCDEFDLQPSVFYAWQKQLFENLESALVDGRGQRRDHAQRKIESLEGELAEKEAIIARKEMVIAEVTEEYVGLKKELGEAISKAVGRHRT